MSDSAASSPKKRWRFRLSLATLLVFVACFSGYLAGLRLGADASAEQRRRAEISTQTYAVSDLIEPIDPNPGWSPTEGEFLPLIELVTSTLDSEEWREATGSGASSISPFASNSSIVVTCSGDAHDQLASLLHQLRDLRYRLPGDYLDQVREVAARGIPTRQIIKAFTATSPANHKRMENHFSAAMADLRSAFGRPDLVAAAGDAEFPSWLAARRTAVWDRRRGKLYFALVDCRPDGEALVAGWWEPGGDALGPIVFAASP
ncbi:MAG: hypothetical protein AAGJ46_10835 [Planctomycetota bacterium]